MGAREAPLLDDVQQRLGSSVGHHLQHTSSALSFDGPEHPHSVVEPPSVVLAVEKVALVDLDNDRLTVDIEASELHRVCAPKFVDWGLFGVFLHLFEKGIQFPFNSVPVCFPK